MNKEEAQAIIQKAVLEIQDGGFALMPVIRSHNNQAQSSIEMIEMTAAQHKEYLAKKPVPVETTNPTANENS